MDIPASNGNGITNYGTTKYDLGENSRGTNKALTLLPCLFFLSGHCRAGNRCSHSHNCQTIKKFANYKSDYRTECMDSRVYIAPVRDRTVSGPDTGAASSSQYDPVTDSLDLINSIISEQEAGMALMSELPPTGDLFGVALHETDHKDIELMEMNVKSHQSSENKQFADCKDEKQNILKEGEIKERKDESKVVSEVEVTADKTKEITDAKILYAFKFALAGFVKELLSPIWKERKIGKETYKTIVKKVVDKVIFTVPTIYIPRTQEQINSYLAASKPNISKLVQAYIKRENAKAEANAA